MAFFPSAVELQFFLPKSVFPFVANQIVVVDDGALDDFQVFFGYAAGVVCNKATAS